MHTAPAVAFDADDGGRWRVAVAALTGVTAGVAIRWAVQWAATLDLPVAGWPAVDLVAGVVGGLAASLAAWRLGRPPPARLTWNSHEWLWQPEGRPALAGRVRVVADLGGWMLLRFDPLAAHDPAARLRYRPAGRPRWIPLAAPGGAIRAALVASARADGRAASVRGA